MLNNENDEDDLFLSDIGDLSQIYDDDTTYNKNFSGNGRYKKRPVRINNPHRDGGLLTDKRFKHSFNSKSNVAERNNSKTKNVDDDAHFLSNNSESEMPSTTTLYDEADIRIPELNRALNSKVDQSDRNDSIEVGDGIYDEFELSESKNFDIASRNVTQSQKNKSSFSDSLSNFMNSQDIENVPWRKSKPTEQNMFDERPFNELTNPSPPGVFEDRRMIDEKAFGKWLDEIPPGTGKVRDIPKGQQTIMTVNDSSINPEKLNADELLDEDYPTVNPFDVIKSYQSLKMSMENKTDDKNESFAFKAKNSSNDSKNEEIIRQTLEGIRKKFDDDESMKNRFDDDIIVLSDDMSFRSVGQKPESGRIKMSLIEPKLKTFSESSTMDSSRQQTSSCTSGSQLDSGSQIPVLTKKVVTTTYKKTPSNIPTHQYSTAATSSVISQPPPVMSGFQNPNYGMTNPPMPNFMNNYNTENGGMFSTYREPMMNNPPANNEFFNPASQQQMQYSNFSGSMHQTTSGWIPSMDRSMISNSTSVSCLPGSELPFVEEDALKSSKDLNSEGVKKELRQQNMSLMAQRDTYYKKYNFLNEELEKLKEQKKELLESKKSHQVEKYLKANQQLQSDIQSKIKAVKNVIDMLSKIIKDDEPKISSDIIDDNKRSEFDEKKETISKSFTEKKQKRKSRSRSRSRHRSGSRSRGRRSRSSRSRSRSYSPKRHRRRSRSRDKYYRRRRSPEKRSKYSRRSRERSRPPEERSPKMTEKSSVLIVDPRIHVDAEVPVVPETNKMYAEKFKATFEEVPVMKTFLSSAETLSEKTKNLHVATESPKQSVPASYTIASQKTEVTAPTVEEPNVNYVYYDPEIHWCQVCDVFPRTAKEYLQHLHDPKHKEELAKRNLIDYPWHKLQTETKKSTHPDAPSERIPIRGLPFFVSATAWYCKLCNEWMGDLHCASTHLKSEMHESKYTAFMESNPLWEETWMQSRSKALELYSRTSSKSDAVYTCAIPPSHAIATVVPETVPFAEMKIIKQSTASLKTKKRSSSSSSDTSSSSSSSESSSSSDNSRSKNKKSKKSKASKHKKRKKEATTKTRPTAAEMRLRSREPPIDDKPKSNLISSFEPPSNKNEDDKFVEEWMNPVRSNSKEREFLELKNKLKKKEAEEKNKNLENKRRVELRRYLEVDRPNVGRNDERDKNSPDRSRRYNRSTEHDDRNNRSPENYNRKADVNSSNKSNTKNEEQSIKKMLDKPITIGKCKFPFIGKMPSKTKKNEVDKSKIVIKGLANKSNEPALKTNSSDLSAVIKKQIEEYEKIMEPEQDNTVVDMDINDDEDVSTNIVIDDTVSRKKDFDETLKLLYPEENENNVSYPMTSAGQLAPEQLAVDQIHPGQLIPGQLPQNLTRDYLMSLIETTLVQRLKMKIPSTDTSNSAKLLELMQQTLFSGASAGTAEVIYPPGTAAPGTEEVIAEIPVPRNSCGTVVSVQPNGETEYAKPPPPPLHPTNIRHPIDRESIDDSKTDVGKSSGSETEVGHKKKKNPISQKKRRHLAKIRQKLEEQEKHLQAKIEETKKNLNKLSSTEVSVDEENASEVISEPLVMSVDSELMMLGIEESDSAALQF